MAPYGETPPGETERALLKHALELIDETPTVAQDLMSTAHLNAADRERFVRRLMGVDRRHASLRATIEARRE